jgi:hypothetical protein
VSAANRESGSALNSKIREITDSRTERQEKIAEESDVNLELKLLVVMLT